MAEICENIKRLRHEAGMSQEKLGEILGKTRSAISQYESGKIIPRMGVIEDMSQLFGVKKSEIIGESVIPALGMSTVPLVGRIAAGDPIPMEEYPDTGEAPTRLVEEDPDAFLLRVDGDSVNRLIPDGSVALVSPKHREPNEHDLFAVCVNGYDATIKHVRKLANGFMLVPDSHDPTYRPQVFDYNDDATDTITIIGKVVWASVEL